MQLELCRTFSNYGYGYGYGEIPSLIMVCGPITAGTPLLTYISNNIEYYGHATGAYIHHNGNKFYTVKDNSIYSIIINSINTRSH